MGCKTRLKNIQIFLILSFLMMQTFTWIPFLCVCRQWQPFPDEEHAVLVAVWSGGDRSHAEADHQTHASAYSSGALALSHHRWCSQPPQRCGLLHTQHTHSPQLSRYANAHQTVHSSQIRSRRIKHEWNILLFDVLIRLQPPDRSVSGVPAAPVLSLRTGPARLQRGLAAGVRKLYLRAVCHCPLLPIRWQAHPEDIVKPALLRERETLWIFVWLRKERRVRTCVWVMASVVCREALCLTEDWVSCIAA